MLDNHLEKQNREAGELWKHPKPLGYFIENGICLIPTYPNKNTCGSWKAPEKFLYDIQRVKSFWKSGIRWFQLYPYQNGLVVIDIDIKNGKNGLNELYDIFLQSGQAIPDYLLDVETHPFHVRTPSGGYHLYFEYHGNKRFQSGAIHPDGGLEVVHYLHLITAPGSIKENGKRYELFMKPLARIPELPLVIESFIPEWKAKFKKPVNWTPTVYSGGQISLDKISETVISQGRYHPSTGRNNFCCAVATFARKKGYSQDETLSFLTSRYAEHGFTATEINNTVKSAYK